MASNKIRLAASFFLILTSLNLMSIAPTSSEKLNCYFFQSIYKIYVANNLPKGSPPLYAHCYSGDRELGNRTMNVNDQISWSFCNRPHTTMYACGFVWKNRFAAFEVFNASVDTVKCSHLNLCYYSVGESGFSFITAVYPPKDLFVLKHKW